ncbi:MAG: hypothetical protein QNK04_18320 [Myxococcota bacterium]|nr:hypothetical protein [Myxococcota bacterium]
MAEHVLIFRGRGVHPDWPARLEEAQQQDTISIAGQDFERIRYGDEPQHWGAARTPCHDCVAIRGEFHVPGCDMESCPACGGQMIACGCLHVPEP